MTLPALATTTANGRTYDVGGATRPSVTTTTGILPKTFMYAAREKTIATAALDSRWQHIQQEEGDEAAIAWLLAQANVKRDEASERGSDVHHALDFRVKNGGWAAEYERVQFDYSMRLFSHESIRGYCAAFDAFLKAHEPRFLLTEETVYSDKHDYAGTLDAVMRIDGKNYVVDYKTGGVYESAAYQLAAYAFAESTADGKELPPIDGAFILNVLDNDYKVVMVNDLPTSFQHFLKLRAAYDVTRLKKSEVLARPAKRVG